MLKVSGTFSTGLRSSLTAALMIALAACSTPPWDGAETIRPTVAKGLVSIERYYVDPVHMQALSLSGIESIAALGDDLALLPSKRYLNLIRHGEILSQYPWPPSPSADLWSLFTVAVMADLRNHSDVIANLHQDDILDSYFLGLTSGLDNFTRYASPARAKQQRENREGFGGIGLSVEHSEHGIRITEIALDSPADRNGIEVGDMIVSIDGASVANWPLPRVKQRLHGRIGTVIRLGLQQAGSKESRDLLLRRTEIIPNTVTHIADTAFPTLRIARFNKKTAERVAQTLDSLSQDGDKSLQGIVLDLRGNPGGLLDEAVETADLFLDHGTIASTEGRHPQSDQQFDASSGDIAAGTPIVILTDGGTASAAEILAAALQDHRRAVVVGTVSYGKGTVQKVLDMPNDGELALTWARYLTPSQYAIHEFGVLPTICTAHYENGVAAVLKTLRKSPWQADMRFRYLRTLQYRGVDQVKEFRGSCPWNGQAPQEIDLEAAEALLSDLALYQDALELGNNVYAVK